MKKIDELKTKISEANERINELKKQVQKELQAEFTGALTELFDAYPFVTSLPSHRALTHNTWFVSTILTRVFGEVFKRKSDGKLISTRDIGEQHIAEDFNGFIPSASDYLDCMNVADWMMNGKGAPPSHALILKQRKVKETVEQPHNHIHID